MSEIDDIIKLIAKASLAISSKAESDKLWLNAHKMASDYLLNKFKEIFNKASAIDRCVKDLTKEKIATEEERVKPYYDRAESAMCAFKELCQEFETLKREIEQSKDITRKKRLLKMMKIKNAEIEQCGKLQEEAENKGREYVKRIELATPLVSRAYKLSNQAISGLTPLISSSISLSFWHKLYKLFPVLAALAITLLIDSWTNSFENVMKIVEKKEFHTFAILLLFLIQYLGFDKIKNIFYDKMQARSIAMLEKAFSEHVNWIDAAEADLAIAEEACMVLAKDVD